MSDISAAQGFGGLDPHALEHRFDCPRGCNYLVRRLPGRKRGRNDGPVVRSNCGAPAVAVDRASPETLQALAGGRAPMNDRRY